MAGHGRLQRRHARLAGIDRLDPDSVRGAGNEPLLEIGALDGLVDEDQPLVTRRRLEICREWCCRIALGAASGRHCAFEPR